MESKPTASITGRGDWEWNRLQDDRIAERGADRPPEALATDSAEHDLRMLEGALEREERRLQCIIAHYERLLDEKDRQLAEATADPPRASRGTALLQAVRRLVSGR